MSERERELKNMAFLSLKAKADYTLCYGGTIMTSLCISNGRTS